MRPSFVCLSGVCLLVLVPASAALGQVGASTTRPDGSMSASASVSAPVPEKKSSNFFSSLFSGRQKISNSDPKTGETYPVPDAPRLNEQRKPVAPSAATAPTATAPTSKAPAVKVANEPMKQSEPSREKRSMFSSWLEPSKDSSKSKSNAELDDGLDQVEHVLQEKSFSEKDYFASATKSEKVGAKDLYARGMEQESQGDYQGAVRSYHGFIKANKKRISDGTLASPYHRLALISWKNREFDKSEIYFKYGMKYAQGGNIPVISGDYAFFLMDQGQLHQAEIVLRNTLLHYPEDKRLLLTLGRCLGRQNKTIEAMRYLTASVGKERAYQEMAMIYHRQGDYALAQSMVRQREDYIAQTRVVPAGVMPVFPSPMEQSSGSAQYAQRSGHQVPAATRIEVPARVMEKPPVSPNRGMTAKSTLVYPVPYPTKETLSTPNRTETAVHTQAAPASVEHPVFPVVPSVTPAAPVVPEPVSLEQGDRASMPVSRVYHYPAGSTTAVYHQYQGPDYPRAVTVPPDPFRQTQPYTISTVPQGQGERY